MTEHGSTQLPIVATDAHACSCCGPSAASHHRSAGAQAAGVEATFGVQGMTCSHCVTSVTEELSALAGVTRVRVDLQAGGVSQVVVDSTAPLDRSAVSAAVDEAGYTLVSA